jgi:NADPH:quinone reductase-like Zn-dependent oxidoreductase
MRSYHTSLGAGIDGLSVREHDTPEPGLNEVLVHVRASSLSFRELMVLRGWYPLPVKPDVIPISEGAGDVVAVGEHVSAQFLAMNRAIEANRLTPVIDRVFPFEEAVEAYRYYQAAQPLGTVVIAHP